MLERYLTNLYDAFRSSCHIQTTLNPGDMLKSDEERKKENGLATAKFAKRKKLY